jgi:hypothetical protein
MKTAVSKFVLGWTNGGMKFVLTLALTLNPLPHRNDSVELRFSWDSGA